MARHLWPIAIVVSCSARAEPFAERKETIRDRRAGWRRLVLGLLPFLAPGCAHEPEIPFTTATKPPTVQLVHPADRTIVRDVGQPSFVVAYERTSIYSKPTAYIEKWIVDIGDRVKKDDVLATLFVPELVEDHKTKVDTVELDKERIELAKEAVEVAQANVKVADAHLAEAKAILEKYQSEVARWQTQVTRLQLEAPRDAIAAQVLTESTNQLKSSIAARDQAKAMIKKAEAEVRLRRAEVAKAEVYVKVTEADLKVAEYEEKRLAAWVGYLTLTAPFDGVVVARNANTFDFLLPTTGDPTAHHVDPRSPHLSPSGAAAPVYVIDRTDIVRVFVDIPEQDANYVHVGSKATVLVRGYRDEPIPATVTRTAWALNAKSRTLRTEVDLPNPNSQLLPGMYAYVSVIIERPGVRALPAAALTYDGDQAFFWTYELGHATRNEVETGVSDGQWIEVTNRRVRVSAPAPTGEESWIPIDGSERVILGDLTQLVQGAAVEVAATTSQPKVSLAGPSPSSSRAP
jgi:HlyD family secretion protein